jgi:hypothetical protein
MRVLAAVLKMVNISKIWKRRIAPLMELITDIEQFLPSAIFKMAATILHKFNIVRFQRPELIPDIEKFLPVSI